MSDVHYNSVRDLKKFYREIGARTGSLFEDIQTKNFKGDDRRSTFVYDQLEQMLVLLGSGCLQHLRPF